MIPERVERCLECKIMKEPHGCIQVFYPLNEEEYKQIGITPDTFITPEVMLRFMKASIRPECLEGMLKRHPIEWWTVKIRGGDV